MSASAAHSTPELLAQLVHAFRQLPALSLSTRAKAAFVAAGVCHFARLAAVEAQLVLQFLDIPDKLRAARSCKRLHAEAATPHVWRSSGWWCTRYYERADSMPLPAWLCAQLFFVRCSLSWLLQAAPLARLRQFAQLRHLELDRPLLLEPTVSAHTLRQALSPLPLQTLLLPFTPGVLLAALTEPSAQGEQPLLATWALSLTHLRCEISTEVDDAILRALSNCSWPLLQRVNLCVRCGKGEPSDEAAVADVLQQLQRWWSPQSAPSLTSLKCRMGCFLLPATCSCPYLAFPALSEVRSLSELHLDCRGRALDLIRMISTDAMPLLRLLTVSHRLADFASDEEKSEAVTLLRRMPLTAFREESRSGIGPLLHHLPQLRDLICADMEDDTLEAVASAPQLQRLALCERPMVQDVLQLLRHWWRRMGYPPLYTGGRVDEAEWQQHLGETSVLLQPVERAGAAPPLRELIIRSDSMLAVAFPYLAQLPQLRVLECTVLAKDLCALGLLPQLEELRLRPETDDDGGVMDPLVDSDLHTLGGLQLLRLHTLQLHNTDEKHAWCIVDKDHRSGSDPDFLWGGRDDRGCNIPRAVLQTGVTLDGLRALLQLPALTTLDLPWICSRTLVQFRQLAQQQGRTTLRIDRPVPLSRRSRLERHWLSLGQLGADDP